MNEILELQFGLSVALFEERPIDERLDSMLAVRFSSILGYSKSRQSFLQAWDFTTHLFASFTTSDLFFSSVRCRSELVLQEIGAGSRTSRYDESPLTKFYMDVNAWRWLAKLYQGKNFSTWGWKLQLYTPCSRSVSPNTQSNYSRVLFHCVSTGKEIYLVSLI